MKKIKEEKEYKRFRKVSNGFMQSICEVSKGTIEPEESGGMYA